MKHLLYVLLLLTSIACAKAPVPTKPSNIQRSGVPVSVSSVQIDLVGNHIVRAIQHNMEINPVVQFEIMSRPTFTVLNTLTINEISHNGEILSLKNATGAFVESITFNEDNINILFDYFYPKGGSVLLSCTLAIKDDNFAPLSCNKK
ncbi:MAG: hypothetical protein ACI93R_003128 [Flavobacteriales bacterium]|jgi:hypothetical protein